MILNIRHTGLVVRDLQKSIKFYETLGLKIWRCEKESGTYIDMVTGISGVRIEWAKMKCPCGSMVELLQYHSHPDLEPISNTPANRLGCSHLAFTVDDIEKVCLQIIQLGGSLVNPPTLAPSGEVKVAYCYDPDGILIEVVEEITNQFIRLM